MREEIVADKKRGKAKILELRKKRALEQKKKLSEKQDKAFSLSQAEKKSLELFGVTPRRLKLLGKSPDLAKFRSLLSKKAKNIIETDARKNMPDASIMNQKKKVENIVKNIQSTLKKDTGIEGAAPAKTVTKTKAGKSDDSWKKYSSIAAAKKAGSLYYSKNGKKMAAVTKDMMKEAGYTSFGPKMLTKYMNERLAKTKKLSQGGALKPVPTGNKGKGLSKLPTPVRNKMGFMYGGGMPMPSKKPRISNTDYRKAAKGMLIISINVAKKKKGKGKGKKKS